MNDKQLKEITERLDIIIKMISFSLAGEADSLKERIGKLSAVGMSPSQIGRLLGKPTNFVTAYTARIKKSSK